MTTVNFSDFAATLQAAQAAIDNAPKLEQERDSALHQRDEAQSHAQALEQRVITYKEIEADLHAKLREAEAARDTFRHEVASLTSVRDRLVSAFSTAADMVQDEVRQLMPQPAQPDQAEHPAPEQGQSATDPTSAPSSSTQNNMEHGMTSTSDPFSADPGPSGIGPYFGKRYQAHPGYVDRQNWLAGGGTAYDYDWRSGTPYSPPGASDPSGEPASQSYTSYSGETKRYV